MKKIRIFFVTLVILVLSSCHDEFLEDRAYSVITEDNFFKTASDALTAVNGVYNALRDNGMYQTDLLWLNEYPSETVTTRLNIGSQQSDMDLWNFQVGNFASIYSSSFKLIERANQVIANVPKCDMLQSLKDRVIAEAMFLRSLAYFNLVRVYGGVPLKLTPTTDLDQTQFPRESAEKIYQQIVGDLTQILDKNWLPKTKTYTGDNKGRVGKSGVQALLGKVYLTRAKETFGTAQDYQKSIEVLKALVADADHSLLTSYANIFSMTNENSAEVIFDIQNVRVAGLGGNLTAFLASAVSREFFIIPYYDFPANIDFYTSFENADTRRAATFHDRMKVTINNVANVEVYFDPANNPYEGMWRRASDNTVVPRAVIDVPAPGFRKFLDTDPTARINAEEPNYIILRYSDVLLMLAEAINEGGGPTAEAYDYLNMVKRRAYGLPINAASAVDYTGLSQQAFREAVFTERRKELVMEGHSWFDGKRFWDIYTQRVADASVGADPNINNRPKAVINVNTIRNDKFKFMPFSIDQLDLNKQLKQNDGY